MPEPMENPPEAGCLVIVATPIGNIEDASPRLRRLLTQADVVAAEDTRRLTALASRLGIRVGGRVVSMHEHNEERRADQVLDSAESGGVAVLVSDAGMPTVSDPGYRIVTRAIERGIPVTAAPGPSAVLTALALSGLPTDRFTFEGFIPRRSGERHRMFQALVSEPRTMVFFESPHRVDVTLQAMTETFGADRRIALARELTKTYEQVIRGSVAQVLDVVVAQPPRGEICLVVAGASPVTVADIATLVPVVQQRIAAGERLKDAVAAVAGEHGVSRRELYDLAVKNR